MKDDVLAFCEGQQTQAAMEHCPDVEFFGAARRRHFARENEQRAQRGEPPLVNDEDEDPSLTAFRRQRTIDCLAKYVYPGEPEHILPWRPD